LKKTSEGNERRKEMLEDILSNSSFLPKTVTYKDIDEAFKSWVEEKLVIKSDNGNDFPTMVLYSNQRFSEYTQSWKYTDKNNNLMLNFKTVSRENNPQYGKIQNGYWNIPGERFYTMRKEVVMDDNGSESFLVMKMKQPTAIDLNYKVSIFTTQYHSINDFNDKINRMFNSRQCYISPNNHFMPMTLESISDESSYNIDDRQFYGQVYQINVKAYIITEEDYRVEEMPLKHGFSIPMAKSDRSYPDVEIEECEDEGFDRITVTFPEKTNKNTAEFTIDTDFKIDEINIENLYRNYKFFVNDNIVLDPKGFSLKENDTVKIVISKQDKKSESKFLIISRK
jgi:hypothetical protein